MIHKQRVKATGRAISHNRVIQENVPRKITEFSMGRHVGVPSEGHQHGGRKPAKTSEIYLGYFIVDEIGLLHPIYYDVYDLCQYRKTNKLSQFNVSMLKNILKNYEVPFTAKDRKKDLVQHLAIFVKKCSCFL